MYTAGIVTLIVCLAVIILFTYLSEREMSEDACVFLGIIIFCTFLLGSFWLSQGSYDKGYEQGAIDMANGKLKYEVVQEYKIENR